MGRKILITVFVAALGIAGCRESGTGTDGINDSVPAAGENFDFYTSETMYKDLFENRSEETSSSFEITDVWQTQAGDGKYLHVEIAHMKACDDQFEVIWDGRIAESYPPQVYLFVKLDAENCSDSDAFITDTLSVNLYELIGEKDLAYGAVFRISNASSSQDVSYDSSVSTDN